MEKIDEKDVQIHIDYLSFTIPLESEIDVKYAFEEIKEDLANLFWLTSINYGKLLNWGKNGYEYELSLGENISVRYGGERNAMKRIIDWDNNIKSEEKYDSLMVEVKGQGCREIEFLSGGNVDYLKIISWVELHGGKFTRIDIAIDDMKGDVIRLNKILDTVAKGLYTSSFKAFPYINDTALKKNNYHEINIEDEPCTLYFGKTTSDKQLCIYNKKAERKNKNDSWPGEYWIRYEMRFRHDAADNLAYFMQTKKMNDIGVFACEQLKTLLTLKCPYYNGKKSNIRTVRMLDILPAWDKFLNAVKGEKLTLRPILESTIDRKILWRTHSLSKMDVMLYLADAYEDSEWCILGGGKLYKENMDMLSYLKEKRDNITSKDLAMINNYRRSHKKSGTFEELTEQAIDELIKTLENELELFKKRYILPF